MPLLLKELSDATDQLIQTDPFSYSDSESMKELERQLGRLGFMVSKALANFESSGEFDSRRPLSLKVLVRMGVASADWSAIAPKSAHRPQTDHTCLRLVVRK
jgi:hypothetical protein